MSARLFTVPFSSAPTKFGTWNLHGGVNFLALGDGTKSFNVKDGDRRQPGDRVDRHRPVRSNAGVGGIWNLEIWDLGSVTRSPNPQIPDPRS